MSAVERPLDTNGQRFWSPSYRSEDTPTERRVVDFRDHLATLRIATQHQRNGCPGTGFGPQALNGVTNARYAKRPPDLGPGAVPMRREGDSNPWCNSAHPFWRRVQSAALPSLHVSRRGHWPTIALCLMLTPGAFPDRLVIYGGDHVAIKDHRIMDDDVLHSYWQAYYASVWQDTNNESDDQ